MLGGDHFNLFQVYDDTDRVGFSSDYNVFYHVQGTLHFIYGGTGSAGYINFTDWKTASGQDADSSISQPLLVKTTGTSWSDFDVQLQSGDTVAKGKGTTGLLPYDYNYTPRFQGSAWDIGAYE